MPSPPPVTSTPVLLRSIVEWDRRDQPIEALRAMLRAVARLPEGGRVPELNSILEELVQRAERGLQDERPMVVLEVILTVLSGEDDESYPPARAAFQMARRRLLTSPYLCVVARLLPRLPERRKELLRILRFSGEEGADVVIEHLATASSSSDRRAYYSALARMKSGEESLMQRLDDRRWYVVRNAAELLGEMEVAAAEPRLVPLLTHEDERVRRAVLGSLGRLGTARALHAVQESLRSPDPALRAQAAGVLATSNWPYTVAALGRRLREEPDEQVRLAMVAALGRLGTDQAMKLLEELSDPPRRGMGWRRRGALRSAAADALAVARAARASGPAHATAADPEVADDSWA